MEQTAETVENDTVEAMAKVNLPANGIYSQGDTADAIVRNAKAVKNSVAVEIDIGFDKTKPGAGGFLITGTPKMRPNWELERIYGQKKYEIELEKDISQLLQDEIVPEQIKLIHAIIWLSLTTYAWEDYDSICGAFYLGLFYFYLFNQGVLFPLVKC